MKAFKKFLASLFLTSCVLSVLVFASAMLSDSLEQSFWYILGASIAIVIGVIAFVSGLIWSILTFSEDEYGDL